MADKAWTPCPMRCHGGSSGGAWDIGEQLTGTGWSGVTERGWGPHTESSKGDGGHEFHPRPLTFLVGRGQYLHEQGGAAVQGGCAEPGARVHEGPLRCGKEAVAGQNLASYPPPPKESPSQLVKSCVEGGLWMS